MNVSGPTIYIMYIVDWDIVKSNFDFLITLPVCHVDLQQP